MDMQEKRLPVFGGEDPSLPWPDSSGRIATLKFVPDVVPTFAPNHSHNGNPSTKPMPGSDSMGNADMRGEDDMMRAEMTPSPSNPATQPISDSIDPRLMSLAMGFVPYQAWETPYAFDVGLKRGTIFPSLDMPWLGEEAFSQ